VENGKITYSGPQFVGFYCAIHNQKESKRCFLVCGESLETLSDLPCPYPNCTHSTGDGSNHLHVQYLDRILPIDSDDEKAGDAWVQNWMDLPLDRRPAPTIEVWNGVE
jgi:hypothetical protein